MSVLEIIAKKRDGYALSEEEIGYIVENYTAGNIPDYQMAALLMAIFIRGMNREETLNLTRAMIESGKPIKWETDLPRVDKHSTGGVGDKVSLPLAPLVAVYGVLVPMISGRALGHTGGTLDKLESIPGYRTDLSVQEFKKVVMGIGASIIGQTEELAPADRKIYALRDATATVESIPLISASIMSKKLSEGLTGLVLDVKTGSGAFMEDYGDARNLAETMVEIGKGYGVETVALITDMDVPLGWAAGNACEVCESVQLLKGRGPEDLRELVITLGGWMLKLGGKVVDVDVGKELIDEAIKDGRGLRKFKEMVEAHGGDFSAVEREDFLGAEYEVAIKAESEGYITSMNTKRIGWAATILGAGRLKKEDRVDHRVCVFTLKKTGDRVEKGDTIFRVFANDEERLSRAVDLLRTSFTVGLERPRGRSLVHEIIR